MMSEKEQEKFLEEVSKLLTEIRNEQIQMEKNIENYHKINMRNFSKLREFNEICDMTNQVFERRIKNIEKVLLERLNEQAKK